MWRQFLVRPQPQIGYLANFQKHCFDHHFSSENPVPPILWTRDNSRNHYFFRIRHFHRLDYLLFNIYVLNFRAVLTTSILWNPCQKHSKIIVVWVQSILKIEWLTLLEKWCRNCSWISVVFSYLASHGEWRCLFVDPFCRWWKNEDIHVDSALSVWGPTPQFSRSSAPQTLPLPTFFSVSFSPSIVFLQSHSDDN